MTHDLWMIIYFFNFSLSKNQGLVGYQKQTLVIIHRRLKNPYSTIIPHQIQTNKRDLFCVDHDLITAS